MTQPEALRLADVMHNDPCSAAHHDEAAFELRRLHAENESLRQIVQDFPPVEAELREVSDRAHRLETQRDALRAELKEATEAINDPAVNNLRTLAESIRMLSNQRDALLEALRTLLSYANTLEMRLLEADGEHRAMQRARAAIKQVEEGQ